MNTDYTHGGITECYKLAKKLPSAQALFTFQAAARAPSFSEAGRLLNVTQPAVRKNIAALEAHIGTRLFIREKSKLRLNAEGEIPASRGAALVPGA